MTTINNASANLQFPRVSTKAGAATEGEADESANSGLDMDTVTMTPKRVANKTLWSKQLILQGGAGIDALISRELAAGINEHIDKAVFAAAVAGASGGEDIAGALTYAALTDAEKDVLAAGGDLSRCAFIGSPSAMSIIKGETAVSPLSGLCSL